MRELMIISYDPGTTYTKHYVVEPTGNSAEGTAIGSMYIAGNVLTKFPTYDEAVQFVKAHR
ncbi:hypothetical protein L4X63_23045 [Geomonas sp. Red32]|uniref:hypothetical protein n=1 Tax=Geomonas sp. Red32 TaxID=2912856 RepID=UPI00202CDA84|nr:hypothetical protein [Geomonas sp. Red32]MCM0084459.1 hypothetical protein [Geomonas sp. Red32]